MQFPHNRLDPDVWTALELDNSIPFDPEMRIAWVKDSSRWSRQFMLPVMRPFLVLSIGLIQLYKVLVPNLLTSSRLLHKIVRFGLRYFVTPEGNYLFLRHFHLGSQVLDFLRDNIEGVQIETEPLLPTSLADVRDNLIIRHDINLYNFIIDLNTQLRDKKIELKAKGTINFSSIFKPEIGQSQFKNSWLNFIDIHTATEMITPVFQLLLTDREFWRAVYSLQLDETMGLYFAKILNLHSRMYLVNNKHPMVPVNTIEAPQRLTIHSMSTEALHGMLWQLKNSEKFVSEPHYAGPETTP